jgi:hypothetical protein
MNIDEFKQHQRNSGCDFEIVGPGDPGYDNDRVIANSRFNYFPCLIAYCENAEHASCCINYCRNWSPIAESFPVGVAIRLTLAD